MSSKQREMSTILGDEIATRLLTPETMVDELVRLVDLTLTDDDLTKQLQSLILPFIQEQLPVFFRRSLGSSSLSDFGRIYCENAKFAHFYPNFR